jgi:FkbM family methyltransferase
MNIIFEVGANLGLDTKRFADNENNVVFAFEPTPKLFSDLTNNFKHYSNIKIYPYAIDVEEGISEFNIAGSGDWGCSSLYKFSENIHELWENRPDFSFTESCLVEKKRLDSIIESESILDIDYLWIDAQGNDFRVLQSLGNRINIVREGKCEGSYTVELYTGTSNRVEDIVQFLNDNGFSCQVIPDNVNKEADVHFKRI